MEQGTAGRDSADADSVFVDAWTQVLPDLRRRALRLTGGSADHAEDLIANTALKALLFMRRSPEMLTDPNGFLFVVLRHVFLDSVRRRGREDRVIDGGFDDDRPGAEAPEPAPSALQRMETEERLARVAASLARMKVEHRRLFAYRFLDDLPYPVIADRLRVDEAVARKRIQLLRRRLRAATDGAP